METPADLIEELVEKTEAYSKTTFRLARLKAVQTGSAVATVLVVQVSVVVMLMLFVLVLNIGIALWLGEMLGKTYYGFFIVAAFYLLFGILLHFFLPQWIKKPMSNLIIKHVLQ